MSFKITPVDKPVEKVTKRKYVRKHTAGKELSNAELWEFGWLMFEMGMLYRFRIKGVCDMVHPI
jgi:hypothetical protein